MKVNHGRRVSDLSPQFATILGVSAVFKGRISGEGNFEIYGTVEGDSDIKGTLILHESAHWKGNICATHAVIVGTVEGDVVTREKLELRPSAHVKGNIMGGVVAIAEGAVFEGEVHITKKESLKFFNERRIGPNPNGKIEKT